MCGAPTTRETRSCTFGHARQSAAIASWLSASRWYRLVQTWTHSEPQMACLRFIMLPLGTITAEDGWISTRHFSYCVMGQTPELLRSAAKCRVIFFVKTVVHQRRRLAICSHTVLVMFGARGQDVNMQIVFGAISWQGTGTSDCTGERGEQGQKK